MFRKFLQLRQRVHRYSEMERCHRVNCPCVTHLQERVFVIQTKEEETLIKKYDKCLAQSKKWHQKWPL